jgi:hypothetical protein
MRTVTIRNTSNGVTAKADVLTESERTMKVAPQGTKTAILFHKRADGVFRGEMAGLEFELVGA